MMQLRFPFVTQCAIGRVATQYMLGCSGDAGPTIAGICNKMNRPKDCP